MEVHIGEVVSTVQAVDDSALLDPRVMSRIVRAVLEAMRLHDEQEARRRAEQHIPGSEDGSDRGGRR